MRQVLTRCISTALGMALILMASIPSARSAISVKKLEAYGYTDPSSWTSRPCDLPAGLPLDCTFAAKIAVVNRARGEATGIKMVPVALWCPGRNNGTLNLVSTAIEEGGVESLRATYQDGMAVAVSVSVAGRGRLLEEYFASRLDVDRSLLTPEEVKMASKIRERADLLKAKVCDARP